MDTPVNILAEAQDPRVIALGEGRSLANGLWQKIRQVERGQATLAQCKAWAAKADEMLDEIFVTRSVTFERDENDKAPEFNAVKGALNTLRARCHQAYKKDIPARATKASAVAESFGFDG